MYFQKEVEMVICHKMDVDAVKPIKDIGARRTYPNRVMYEGAYTHPVRLSF